MGELLAAWLKGRGSPAEVSERFGGGSRQLRGCTSESHWGAPPPWGSRKKEVWIRDLLSPCLSISVCLSVLPFRPSFLPSFRHPLTHPFFPSVFVEHLLWTRYTAESQRLKFGDQGGSLGLQSSKAHIPSCARETEGGLGGMAGGQRCPTAQLPCPGFALFQIKTTKDQKPLQGGKQDILSI